VRSRLKSVERDLTGRARVVGEYVEDNPWKAIAVAGGIALVIGLSWDANDRRDRTITGGAHGTTGSTAHVGLFRGLFHTCRGGSNSTGLAAVEAEIFMLRTIRMLLWALAALRALAGARLCGRRGSGRIVGYPSNAGRSVGRRIVCRARRGLRLYRQPHVQGRPAMLEGNSSSSRPINIG